MSTAAIDPVSGAGVRSAAQVTQAGAGAKPSAPKAPPRAAPAVSVAAMSTPAATVSTTAIPASVPADQKALYLQLLKAMGGNAAAALAAFMAIQAKAAPQQ